MDYSDLIYKPQYIPSILSLCEMALQKVEPLWMRDCTHNPEKYGIPYLRLNKEFADLSDPNIISQLVDWASENPGVHLFGSLPCTVWSTWQRMSIAKYGEKYLKRLQRRRQKSMSMFSNFVMLAEKGRTVAAAGELAAIPGHAAALSWHHKEPLCLIAAGCCLVRASNR